MKRLKRFQEKHKKSLNKMEFIKHIVKVLLTLADLVTDVINGVKQINRGDTLGTVSGSIIIGVMFLPGLVYGLRSNFGELKALKLKTSSLLCVACGFVLVFPFLIAFSGVASVLMPLVHLCRPGYFDFGKSEIVFTKNLFLQFKIYESFLEGGIQVVVSMYIIMLSPNEDSTFTVVSIVFSALSVFQACHEQFSNVFSFENVNSLLSANGYELEECHRKGFQITFPSRLMSGICMPDLLLIIVAAYPIITNIVNFLGNNGFSEDLKIWTNRGLIGLFVLLGLFSLTRIYFMFLKPKDFSVDIPKILKKRTQLLEESAEKVKGRLRDDRDMPADLFWGIKSKKTKSIFLLGVVVSDALILAMNVIALYASTTKTFKIILFIILVPRFFGLVVNIVYTFKQTVFVDLPPEIVFLDIGDVLVKLTYYSGLTMEKSECIWRTCQLFETMYTKMIKVRIAGLDSKPIVTIAEETLKNLEIIEEENVILSSDTFYIKLKILLNRLEDLYYEYWISFNNTLGYDANCDIIDAGYVQKLRELLLQLQCLIKKDTRSILLVELEDLKEFWILEMMNVNFFKKIQRMIGKMVPHKYSDLLIELENLSEEHFKSDKRKVNYLKEAGRAMMYLQYSNEMYEYSNASKVLEELETEYRISEAKKLDFVRKLAEMTFPLLISCEVFTDAMDIFKRLQQMIVDLNMRRTDNKDMYTKGLEMLERLQIWYEKLVWKKDVYIKKISIIVFCTQYIGGTAEGKLMVNEDKIFEKYWNSKISKYFKRKEIFLEESKSLTTTQHKSIPKYTKSQIVRDINDAKYEKHKKNNQTSNTLQSDVVQREQKDLAMIEEQKENRDEDQALTEEEKTEDNTYILEVHNDCDEKDLTGDTSEDTPFVKFWISEWKNKFKELKPSFEECDNSTLLNSEDTSKDMDSIILETDKNCTDRNLNLTGELTINGDATITKHEIIKQQYTDSAMIDLYSDDQDSSTYGSITIAQVHRDNDNSNQFQASDDSTTFSLENSAMQRDSCRKEIDNEYPKGDLKLAEDLKIIEGHTPSKMIEMERDQTDESLNEEGDSDDKSSLTQISIDNDDKDLIVDITKSDEEIHFEKDWISELQNKFKLLDYFSEEYDNSAIFKPENTKNNKLFSIEIDNDCTKSNKGWNSHEELNLSKDQKMAGVVPLKHEVFESEATNSAIIESYSEQTERDQERNSDKTSAQTHRCHEDIDQHKVPECKTTFCHENTQEQTIKDLLERNLEITEDWKITLESEVNKQEFTDSDKFDYGSEDQTFEEKGNTDDKQSKHTNSTTIDIYNDCSHSSQNLNYNWKTNRHNTITYHKTVDEDKHTDPERKKLIRRHSNGYAEPNTDGSTVIALVDNEKYSIKQSKPSENSSTFHQESAPKNIDLTLTEIDMDFMHESTPKYEDQAMKIIDLDFTDKNLNLTECCTNRAESNVKPDNFGQEKDSAKLELNKENDDQDHALYEKGHTDQNTIVIEIQSEQSDEDLVLDSDESPTFAKVNGKNDEIIKTKGNNITFKHTDSAMTVIDTDISNSISNFHENSETNDTLTTLKSEVIGIEYGEYCDEHLAMDEDVKIKQIDTNNKGLTMTEIYNDSTDMELNLTADQKIDINTTTQTYDTLQQEIPDSIRLEIHSSHILQQEIPDSIRLEIHSCHSDGVTEKIADEITAISQVHIDKDDIIQNEIADNLTAFHDISMTKPTDLAITDEDVDFTNKNLNFQEYLENNEALTTLSYKIYDNFNNKNLNIQANSETDNTLTTLKSEIIGQEYTGLTRFERHREYSDEDQAIDEEGNIVDFLKKNKDSTNTEIYNDSTDMELNLTADPKNEIKTNTQSYDTLQQENPDLISSEKHRSHSDGVPEKIDDEITAIAHVDIDNDDIIQTEVVENLTKFSHISLPMPTDLTISEIGLDFTNKNLNFQEYLEKNETITTLNSEIIKQQSTGLDLLELHEEINEENKALNKELNADENPKVCIEESGDSTLLHQQDTLYYIQLG